MKMISHPCNKRDLSWEYINRSHIHEYRNWERGRAVLFLGIQKLDFQYSEMSVEYERFYRINYNKAKERSRRKIGRREKDKERES